MIDIIAITLVTNITLSDRNWLEKHNKCKWNDLSSQTY